MIEHKREFWIDYLKAFACIFIVLGHFFQSMTAAEIIPTGDLYLWFNQAIYSFHVPVFFICSGYLYQKYSKVNSFHTWRDNIAKKFMILGIPYFFFSILSVLMKNLAGNYVNIPANNIIMTLFITPMSPYWFLYTLFFIFLVTPTISSKKKLLLFSAVALTLKIVLFIQLPLPYLITHVFDNEFWFILGCGIVFFVDAKSLIKPNQQKVLYSSLLLFFIIASAIAYLQNVSNQSLTFILGFSACISFVGIFKVIYFNKSKSVIFSVLSRYTLPIFLMHTIFASGLRIILLKNNVINPYIHIILGIIISFIGPIVTMLILDRLRPLTFVIYPNHIIHTKRE